MGAERSTTRARGLSEVQKSLLESPAAKVPMLTYESFRDKIMEVLKQSGPLTWTEIRTIAKMPEKFPNNKWVHRLETDIGLKRNRDAHGIIKWVL